LFEESFIAARDYLLEVESNLQCVSTYARNFMHFYTLWALIITYKDSISSGEFSDKYSKFMKEFNSIERENISTDSENPYMIYASNSVGANTELPQRQARFDTIKTAFK